MPTKKPTVFERAKMALRTIAFNQGVQALQKSGDFYWEGPPMWQVQTNQEKVRFFAPETALTWAKEQGLSEKNISSVTRHYSKPHVLQWYAKQKALGMNVGSDAEHILSAHVESIDDMIAWFNNIERLDSAAAFNLLRLGFAADRPDVTDAIAKLAARGPGFWFNGNYMSGDTADPFALQSNNSSQMCLFARCLSNVHLLKWLFEHQLHLKHMLFQPDKWKELQQGLGQAHADVRAQWPRVAHEVFGEKTSPLDYDECQHSSLCAMLLHTSFAHDPAAQCYLSYNLLNHRREFSVPETCKNLNVTTFHKKIIALKHQEDAALLSTSPIVDKLMIAVYLEQSPENFYQHAQMVFTHARCPQSVPPQIIINPGVFA